MVPLFYDLDTFQILGQKFVKFFVGFLENLKTSKRHSEIIRPLKSTLFISGVDLMQCCKDSGVKNSCLGICTFNLDLDFLLFDSECIPEFDKAMACGSGNFQINTFLRKHWLERIISTLSDLYQDCFFLVPKTILLEKLLQMGDTVVQVLLSKAK